MGEVYLAFQESLQRHVAIKIIRATMAADETTAQRLLQEGAIVANLTHPNIVKVFDTGICEGQLYLAMEYFDGGTLKDRFNQGLSLNSKLKILYVLLDALGYAHQQGIVHRDIKPQNVLFYPQGRPVLSDFGIAKVLVADEKGLTDTAGIVGSPRYMSPEQLRGEPIDQRIDIYAMGVLLYELLLEQTIYAPVTDPSTLGLRHLLDPVPQLPQEFAAFQSVLNRMMAKNRDERCPDTYAAIAELEHAAALHREATQPMTRLIPRHSDAVPLHQDETQPVNMMPAPQKSVQWRGEPSRKRFLLSGLIGLLTVVAVSAYFAHWQSTSFDTIVEAEPDAEVVTMLDEQPLQRPEGDTEQQRQDELDLVQHPALGNTEQQQQDELEYQRQAEQQAHQAEDPAHQQAVVEPQAELEPEPQHQEKNQHQRIDELLAQAEAQFTARRLTTPAADNAYGTYREILTIDAGNQFAQQGLDRIAQQYLIWAESYKRLGNYSRSLIFIERGLDVAPGHHALSVLKDEVMIRYRPAASSPVSPPVVTPQPQLRGLIELAPIASEPLLVQPPRTASPPTIEPDPVSDPEPSAEEEPRTPRLRTFGTF